MKKIVLSQFIVLLVGTVFAWTNFSVELFSWLNQKKCAFSCTSTLATNPFLTPCFYGAIFFTLAFVLSIIIVKSYCKKS
ncbi:MAG: hypothetical protein WC508_04755 [Patescibacteria group bacterium]